MNDEELATALGFGSVDEMLACCAGKRGMIWFDFEDGQWIAYENPIGRKWEWQPNPHELYEE